MASEVDQATRHLLEEHEKEQEVDQASRQLEQEKEQEREQEQLELQNEREGIMNLKQLHKSSEILKSALTIFTSNTKFMFLSILSIIPFFAFMVFTEIKLQKLVYYVLHFLQRSDSIIYFTTSGDAYMHHQYYETEGEFFSDLVQLCLFYLVLYPLFEAFSMIVTIRMAADARAGDPKQATLKEVLNQNINNFTGLSITFLCVHLLSTLTVTGLFWIVANHCTLNNNEFLFFGYSHNPIKYYLYILSIVIHSAIFIALLYKYLDWRAFWNVAMVISVLEEEKGIGALGMADYYGKHCKRTGFQLMLMFFAFGNTLRLPCLFAGLCSESVSGVLVIAIVIGVFCLANLVKWVAFVLYFYDCKQQTLEKKADVEVGKS